MLAPEIRIKVRSSSDARRKYVVTKYPHNKWKCSCKGWTLHSPRRDCRHIKHVKRIAA